MTVATTTSKTLKIQFEFCEKGCRDGVENKKNVHILYTYTVYENKSIIQHIMIL